MHTKAATMEEAATANTINDFFMFILSVNFQTGVWVCQPVGHGYTPMRLAWGHLSPYFIGIFMGARGL